MAVLERKAELLGSTSSGPGDGVIAGLRQQHDASVVPEVVVAQLRMTIEAEPLPHQCVEVLREEVGEVERARLGIVQCGEQWRAGEELVAVRTR